MSEDLITTDNLSTEMIKSILDAAYMDTSLDSDGDLIVRDQFSTYVFLPSQKNDRIQLLAVFGFNPETNDVQRLEFVNKINSKYIVVKATSGNNDTLKFEYDILVAGGITKKAFVLALRRFFTIPLEAIQKYSDGIVEGF